MKNISIYLIIIILFCPILLKAEHEGELGYCVLCDTPIMERIDNYLRPNEEYTEVWFEFSNGLKGKVGFCKKHAEELTEADYSKIMDGIKNGWQKEFKINKWTKEQVEDYVMKFFTITIVKRLNNEEISINN